MQRRPGGVQTQEPRRKCSDVFTQATPLLEGGVCGGGEEEIISANRGLTCRSFPGQASSQGLTSDLPKVTQGVPGGAGN